MILAIDIGNSCITLGGFEADGCDTPAFVARLATDLHATQDEYASRILAALSLHQIDAKRISGAIFSSVVPPLNRVIRQALCFLFEKDPLTVGPGIKSGVSIRCDMPSSVGADLIATAVAAQKLYTCPALIIDMGTATKMTVVDGSGAFIGASIMPGVGMGVAALSEQTAQLPKISLETPGRVIAKNTVDCMRSGVLYGNAAMIDGMIDRMTREYGAPLQVLATGGMASTIIPLCNHDVTLDEHLLLKGLYVLYLKNRV